MLLPAQHPKIQSKGLITALGGQKIVSTFAGKRILKIVDGQMCNCTFGRANVL